jgi:hypothetical protein
MSKEAHRYLGMENPHDFSILQKHFPTAYFSTIDYRNLPGNVVRFFENYSKRIFELDEYKPRDFTNIIKVFHGKEDLTFIAHQEKRYLSGESEKLAFLCDLLGDEVVGHSELKYGPIINGNQKKAKPFIGHIRTDELRRLGLGTRRVYLMNALSQVFFKSPLYSDTANSPEMEALWEKLEKKGEAIKFKQSGYKRFVLVKPSSYFS